MLFRNTKYALVSLSKKHPISSLILNCTQFIIFFEDRVDWNNGLKCN